MRLIGVYIMDGGEKGIEFSYVQYKLCEGARAFGDFVIGTFCPKP